MIIAFAELHTLYLNAYWGSLIIKKTMLTISTKKVVRRLYRVTKLSREIKKNEPTINWKKANKLGINNVKYLFER